MKDKLGNEGFSLVEAIIALALLAMGILSILTLYSVIVTANMKSDALLDQSVTINGLVDEIKKEVRDRNVKSKTEVDTAVQHIIKKYPQYRFELKVIDNVRNLYEIELIYTDDSRHEKHFYSKIYGGNDE